MSYRVASGRVRTYADRLTAFPQASPELRAAPEQGMIQALGWQAPELTFGAVEFSFPIDAWTVGLLMLEMCGGHWGSPNSKTSYVHRVHVSAVGATGKNKPYHGSAEFPAESVQA